MRADVCGRHSLTHPRVGLSTKPVYMSNLIDHVCIESNRCVHAQARMIVPGSMAVPGFTVHAKHVLLDGGTSDGSA